MNYITIKTEEAETMPLCGVNKKMIEGISVFAEGIFEETLKRSREQKITLEEAFKNEIKDLGIFLETIENKYQELQKGYPDKEAIQKLFV